MTEKEQKQMTIQFFRHIAENTKMNVNLYYLNPTHPERTTRYTLCKNIKPREAYTFLTKDNAYWKNKRYYLSIYFCFVGKKYNIAFIDDPRDSEYVENAFLVVQTSAGKVQAYFKLDEYISEHDLKRIQQYLARRQYNADVQATDARHLRRVVGFANTKYEDKYVVQEMFYNPNAPYLCASEILEEGRSEATRHRGVCDMSFAVSYSYVPTKMWLDFFDNGDESRADMRYAVYLLRAGLNAKDVKEKLKRESMDLQERKKGHIEDYLNRTVSKAIQYLGV